MMVRTICSFKAKYVDDNVSTSTRFMYKKRITAVMQKLCGKLSDSFEFKIQVSRLPIG